MQRNHDEIYEFGSFRLSTLSWTLEHQGNIIHLPKLEFILLVTFLRNPGVFVTTLHLIPDVWPNVQSASNRALQEHVYRLNQALRVGSGGTRLIQFFRGQGYRFFGEVRLVGARPTR